MSILKKLSKLALVAVAGTTLFFNLSLKKEKTNNVASLKLKNISALQASATEYTCLPFPNVCTYPGHLPGPGILATIEP